MAKYVELSHSGTISAKELFRSAWQAQKEKQEAGQKPDEERKQEVQHDR